MQVIVMQGPGYNPTKQNDQQRPEGLPPPVTECVHAVSPLPCQLTLSPEEIDKLLSAQDDWYEAFAALSGVTCCHPEATKLRGAATSTTETSGHNAALARTRLNEAECERYLDQARTLLHPYKNFFTAWLSGEEFFELVTRMWRPLPTEPPSQGTTKDQIKSVGGDNSYPKLLSKWELDSPMKAPPQRADLLALVGKVARFCGWEPEDPMVVGSSATQLPSLSDIQEIRETLVTLLVLIDNLLGNQAPSSSTPLPELDTMQKSSDDMSDRNP